MLRPLILTSVLAGLSLWAADRASLSGRVLDRSAHPVENATVFVYHAGVKTGYSILCPSCYPDCGKKAVTSQTGSFVL